MSEDVLTKCQEGSKVAYFSMEVGLEASVPTYSGGLGVLAGDTLKAAADMGLPIVGVTLIHRKGYFRQHLDKRGNQQEDPYSWVPEDHLRPLDIHTSVSLGGRTVRLRAWQFDIHGVRGDIVPVIFLDADLSENTEGDRSLTDYLYGGDTRYRLSQEVILGMGGVNMLDALGLKFINTFHMNEGHSALLTLGLLERKVKGGDLRNTSPADIEDIRKRCVFTTHTPVPSGHDQFPVELTREVLGQDKTDFLGSSGYLHEGKLNMTYLALLFSRYINGVSMRHEQISKGLFPNYPFNSITNGVHAATWITYPFQALFDKYIPEWRHDNLYLRYALSIPMGEILHAHNESKRLMIRDVKERTGIELDPSVMTLAFARRSAMYKRGGLLFSDTERIKRIAEKTGPIQVLYAGKAHPRDDRGKGVIRRVFEAAEELRVSVPVIYIEEYNMDLARLLCGGVDLWLNTPQKPHEASGTSGMKAALNGVPSFSVMDGWWIEGHVEGVTGWSLGGGWDQESDSARDAVSLYDKLEYIILPMFYGNPEAYARVMRSAITLNGSFFNSQRMLSQYVQNAYKINHLKEGINSHP